MTPGYFMYTSKILRSRVLNGYVYVLCLKLIVIFSSNIVISFWNVWNTLRPQWENHFNKMDYAIHAQL